MVKTEKYEMVDSTTMNLELVGEVLGYLQNFKGLPQGLSSVKERKLRHPCLFGYGHNMLLSVIFISQMI